MQDRTSNHRSSSGECYYWLRVSINPQEEVEDAFVAAAHRQSKQVGLTVYVDPAHDTLSQCGSWRTTAADSEFSVFYIYSIKKLNVQNYMLFSKNDESKNVYYRKYSACNILYY